MSQYYISKVRAKSFKSIGDEWLEITLNKGVNAIVGINGAGKSTLLQAICFAAAGPLSVLGVSKLNELRHIGSNELCEVELFLRPCTGSNKTQKKSNNGSEDVRVHAFINAEGNRVFRLNNRLASGKEVKTKLGRIGVHLGASTSLILQSAVTELSDSTDPLSVGAVIAECSGLQAWAKEAANAYAEQEAQTKDEHRIRQKIETLKITASAARAKASKGEKCAQLEAQVEATAQSCGVQLYQIKAAAERQRELFVGLHNNAVEKEKTLQHQLEKLQEQHSVFDPLGGVDAAISSEPKTKLKLKRIAVEEELQVVSNQLRSYEAAAVALTEAQAREKDITNQYKLALREIELLQQGLFQIEMQSSSVEAAAKAQQEVEALKLQLLEAKHELSAAEATLKEAQLQLQQAAADMEQKHDNLRQYEGFMQVESSATSVEVQLAELAASKRELNFKERSLIAKQQQSSKLVLNGIHIPVLGQCFNFKDPAKVASQYAPALEVLAGRRMDIAIAQSTKQAAHMLASKTVRGLRIWALDAISPVNDRITTLHRHLAATFLPSGSVIVPMDLLSFDKSYEGVISKAFGSHVIVSNIKIGRQVMEQYGIPSIALDGTLTSRGRLAGGWRDTKQQFRGHMYTKIKSDLANENLNAVREQLGELEAAMKALHAQAEAKAAFSAAEQADLRYKEAQAEVTSAENSVEKTLHAAKSLEMELTSRVAVAAALADSHGISGSAFSAGADQKAKLRARITHQMRDLELTKHQQAVAAADVAAATASFHPLHGDDDGTELQEALAELQERLKEIDHQIVLLDDEYKEKQKEHSSAIHAEETRYRQETAEAAEALSAASLDKNVLSEHLDSLTSTLKELKQLAAELKLPNEPSTTISNSPPLDFSEIQSKMQGVHAAAAKHSSLRAELAACRSTTSNSSSVDAVSNYRAAEIAERELSLLVPHADTMHQIAKNLKEGIQLMNPRAEMFNECCFDAVARFFKGLTAQLLPGIELRVARVNSTGEGENQTAAPVHRNGAQFSYRRHHAQDDKWITGLEALSGGQRTLISLAYLVAAKAVGGDALSFSSSVLLADEVDAALDQANQEQAASLLSMLCTKKDKSNDAKPPLAQVVCISHSPIFQQLCDKVNKLTRNNENGATMLAPSSS